MWAIYIPNPFQSATVTDTARERHHTRKRVARTRWVANPWIKEYQLDIKKNSEKAYITLYIWSLYTGLFWDIHVQIHEFFSDKNKDKKKNT